MDAEKLGLGEIIPADKPVGRDAVHVAIIPVVAAHGMFPGQHVAVVDGMFATAQAPGAKFVGIVDPFLIKPVKTGEKFYVWLYPGSITSLCHTWTHPLIPEAK